MGYGHSGTAMLRATLWGRRAAPVARVAGAAGATGAAALGMAHLSNLVVRPERDIAELRHAWQLAERDHEKENLRLAAEREAMHRSGLVAWMAAEERAVSCLPEPTDIVSELNPMSRMSHRTILGRLRPVTLSPEQEHERNRRVRYHGLWLRAFLKNRDGGAPWQPFELLSYDIALDFKRGRFTPTKRDVKRFHKGPTYHLILLSPDMESVASSHRMVATGVETRYLAGADPVVPLLGNCTFTEAPLRKKLRTWVPVCAVNAELCGPVHAGSAEVVTARRGRPVFATVDVEPGVRPPDYLCVDLAGREIHDELYLQDAEVAAGCAAYLTRRMKGPVFRILPARGGAGDEDLDGFRLDLFERGE